MSVELVASESPSTGLLDVFLSAVTFAAQDTNLYELRRRDGKSLPDTAPGAHVDLFLPNGLVRQYSLVYSGKSPKAYVIGVKLDPKSTGGSKALHNEIRVGTPLQISPPRNNFPLADAPHTVLVAGGIGVTPIYNMAQELKAAGKSFEMHYSCRSRPDTAFLEELTGFGDGVHFNFDLENGGKFLDLKGIVAAAPPGSHFYCCGPQPMLAAFEAACSVLPQPQVHVEYFTAKESAAVGGGYVVELKRSGKEVVVKEGMTILDALRDSGMLVPHSCLQGVCGACETKVIEGKPDHRDSILTTSERTANKTMMICCSGSLSPRLVLDI